MFGFLSSVTARNWRGTEQCCSSSYHEGYKQIEKIKEVACLIIIIIINYLWLEEDLSDNAGPGLGLRGSCGIGLGDEDELHELLAPD